MKMFKPLSGGNGSSKLNIKRKKNYYHLSPSFKISFIIPPFYFILFFLETNDILLVKQLIDQFRESPNYCPPAQPHVRETGSGITVCARKRPVSHREDEEARERTGGVLERAIDSVTCRNPRLYVHEARKRVDDTQSVETTEFSFDHTFGDESDTAAIYHAVVRPLVEAAILRGGVSTCFAYGQTGSGKTYTMTGIEAYAAADVFALAADLERAHRRQRYGAAACGVEVRLGFFEIAGDRVYDLLHGRAELFVREDDAGEIHVCGLETIPAASPEELLDYIRAGGEQRCTKATFKNEASSRTHAVCQVTLHAVGGPEAAGTPPGAVIGKLSLVDLAGSERAGDVVHHTQERQRETIAINSSLMTLQECIRCRALEARNAATYVPFRQSKLTMLLRDSFTRQNVATAVIVTLSPLAADTQHTLSTCRFAARIKDRGGAANSSSSSSASSGSAAQDPRTWSKQDVAAWLEALFAARLPPQTARLVRSYPAVTGKSLAMRTLEECAKMFGIDSVGRLVYTEFDKLVQEAKGRGVAMAGSVPSTTSSSTTSSSSAAKRRKSIPIVMDASSLTHPLANRRLPVGSTASPAKRLSMAPSIPSSSSSGAGNSSESMTPLKKRRMSVGGAALFKPAGAAGITQGNALGSITPANTSFYSLLNDSDDAIPQIPQQQQQQPSSQKKGYLGGAGNAQTTPGTQRLAGTIPPSVESPQGDIAASDSGRLQQASKLYGDSPSSSFTLPGKDERARISKLFPGIQRQKSSGERPGTLQQAQPSSALQRKSAQPGAFGDEGSLSSTTLSFLDSGAGSLSKIPRPATGAQEASARLSTIIENANGETPNYSHLTPQQQLFVQQQQLQREREREASLKQQSQQQQIYQHQQPQPQPQQYQQPPQQQQQQQYQKELQEKEQLEARKLQKQQKQQDEFEIIYKVKKQKNIKH